MSRMSDTPIWDALKGHRITSNHNRNWKRARAIADARFRVIEGEYHKPDPRGKELVHVPQP